MNHYKRYLLLILILQLAIVVLKSQYKYDYNWILGYPPNNPGSYFGGVRLDFNDNNLNSTYFNASTHANQTAILSSSAGRLLCYSNGCKILDSNNQVINNGDSISFGDIWNTYCEEFYPGTQNRLILPWPDDSLKAVLFHLKVQDNFQTHYLMYSIIEFDSLYENARVTEKNINLIDIGTSALITATRHANGRDWWILVPEDETNRYFKILFDNKGVSLKDTQNIGSAWGGQEWASQSVFAPNGSMYVRANPWKGIDIMDFDRCSGQLSNIIELGPLSEPIEVGCGAAISLDSRFLYVSNVTSLYQLDLLEEDILSSLVLIDSYDGYLNPFPTTFYQMTLGPDGKIYMFSTNGVKSIHVIEQPTLKGTNCQFKQHGLELPSHISIGAINIPYYRLGPYDGSVCDTLDLNNSPQAYFTYYFDTLNPNRVLFNNLSYFEPDEYFWTFGNSQSSSLFNPGTIIYNTNGLYEVCLEVRNEFGSNLFCRSIAIIDSISLNSEIGSLDKIKVFPNPFNTYLNIDVYGIVPNATFALVNILGKDTIFTALNNGLNSIDVSSLSHGIYFYRVESNNKIISSGKLIKTD